MEQIKAVTASSIPEGVYSAITGGCVSEFKVKGKEYSAEFAHGVRGFGYSDSITIDWEGKIYSSVLGQHAIAVKLKEVSWKEL